MAYYKTKAKDIIMINVWNVLSCSYDSTSAYSIKDRVKSSNENHKKRQKIMLTNLNN